MQLCRYLSSTSIGIGALVIVIGYFGAGVYHAPLLHAYESVTYFVAPSAERAYAYGNRHFDHASAEEYDIDRAEYFFTQAFKRDPHMIYVRHQLARIAFLRGDFPQALRLIDREIEVFGDSVSFSSYYVQGLILGFMGRFELSAASYEKYLAHDPYNWAALNDYAWVLLRNGDTEKALAATEKGLLRFSDNPWLLNTNATARYELGDVTGAEERVRAAARMAIGLSENDWLVAYPGNDPLIAAPGVVSLQTAIAANMRLIANRGPESDVE